MIPSQMIHAFVSQLGGPYAPKLAMYLFGGITSLLQDNQMFSGGLALMVVEYLGNLLSASIVSAFLRALVERIIDAMRVKIAHKTHIYTVARGNVWVHAALSSPTSRNSDLPARGNVGLNVRILSLDSAGMTDESLNSLLATAPGQSMILLEDVDAALPSDESSLSDVQQEGSRRKRNSSVTLSGVLNALDGIAAQEGSICFLTTNHPDRLPAALIRPGRIDIKVELGKATKHQVKEMFARFFKVEGSDAIAKQLAERIGECRATPAELQGLFMEYRDSDPSDILDRIDAWLEEIDPEPESADTKSDETF